MARVKKATETEPAEEVQAEEVVKTEPAKKEAPKKKAASFFMYLGPTIQGVIQTATVFPGTRKDVEKQLAAQIEKFPRIRALTVSGETVAEDRIQVTTPGTRLNAEFRKLAAEARK